MARLCKSRMKHGGEENYHIFLNSVEGISKIIRQAGLPPEECLVVCSVSEDSRDKNLAKLPEGFSIGNTSEKPKLFNFYTSTCFEGQDILDPVGRTFIVSEKYKDHTKMDVMTTLLQICGRIRDSRYKFEIIQIYSDSIYKDVTLEEFKQSILRTVEEAERNAALLDQVSGSSRERLLKEFVNKEPYMDVQDGRIIVDRNLANLQIVNYGIVNGQYKTQCNMNAALLSAGVQVSNDLGKFEIDDEELEQETSIERSPFKEIFEEYAELCSQPFNMNIFRKNRIEIEKPLVKEAYMKLGPDKVREMKYHQSNIKRELTKLQHETLDTKIFLLLDDQLPRQVAIPRSEIKEKLQRIYDELGTNQTAKATDIKR